MEFVHSPKEEEEKEIYSRWIGRDEFEPEIEEKPSYARRRETRRPIRFTPFRRRPETEAERETISRPRSIIRKEDYQRSTTFRPTREEKSPGSPESPFSRRDPMAPSLRPQRSEADFISPREYSILYDSQEPLHRSLEILHKIYTAYRSLHQTIPNKSPSNMYPFSMQAFLFTLADQGGLASAEEVNRTIDHIARGLIEIEDFSNPDYYEQFVDLFGEAVAESLGILPTSEENGDILHISKEYLYNLLESYEMDEDTIYNIIERLEE